MTDGAGAACGGARMWARAEEACGVWRVTDCTCSCHTACGAGDECLPVKFAAAEASQTDEESETMSRALFARKNNDVFGEGAGEEGEENSLAGGGEGGGGGGVSE